MRRGVGGHNLEIPPRRGQLGSRHLKQFGAGVKVIAGRLSVALLVLLICTVSLFSRIRDDKLIAQSQTVGSSGTEDAFTLQVGNLHFQVGFAELVCKFDMHYISLDDSFYTTTPIADCSHTLPRSHLTWKMDVGILWTGAPSDGWRPSSAPRSYWPPPPKESNGYLVVRCNGGLNQQRSAICNAVLAARIMNATLVLPELDTNSFWHDKSGFAGIYDVDHFIKSLKYDVKIVQSLPDVPVTGKKKKKMKPFQLRPPRDASPSWYETVALEKMKEHGAVYLTPFSHRLAEEIDNAEYQRLRCRVNYHALRFKEDVMKLSTSIVNRLRSEGHFMAIHLRFEMDMLSFAGCFDIFTPEEQAILRKYREQNFAEKRLVYSERRIIGKCPLTPEEVGLILNAMGFDNSTRIYLAAGELFGGQRFMKPFHALFPHLENRTTVASAKDLAAVNADGRGLLGPAVDYMVCLLSDIFMPTYDGPSNFANNLLGHRLYYGFRSTIQPDRKALATIFIDRERSRSRNFEALVRLVMQKTPFGGPHKRIHPESFYTNPWPECFCQISTDSVEHKCPTTKFMEVVKNQSSDVKGLDVLATESPLNHSLDGKSIMHGA